MSRAARPRALRRTKGRSRLYLGIGLALFAAATAGSVLLRPRAKPYTPGLEAEESDEITNRLAREVPASAPRVEFTDAASGAGLAFIHFNGRRSSQLPEDMGSGAAWGDYDGDGDPDLYLVNVSAPLTASPEETEASPARSSLFRNDAGRFTDVTDEAGAGARGTGMAAAWGDHDSDGDLDLLVTRFGTNLLFRNDGDGSFSDVTVEAGLGEETGFWAGASWSDYDRDGDADLYVCGYVKYRPDPSDAGRSSTQYSAVVPYMLNPSTYPPERNLLYRNDGGRFREVAAEAGVRNEAGRSLSATWADYDADGWPDLYVANDISDNAMFHNRGDGTFEDVSHEAWVADYRGAMGLAVGDRDNDGDLDVFVAHWIAQENALYDNLLDRMQATEAEPMHFIDDADLVGLGQIALDVIGWGSGFFDYDNDGRLDLLVANGSTFQREDDPSLLVPMRNHLFWNAGSSEGFFEVGEVSGAAFARENVGRGAAFADYDLDGDVDVALVEHGGPARLLRNGGSGGSWSRLLLRGPRGDRGAGRHRSHATSTFAIGARVTLTTGSGTQIREVGGASSYLSQQPPGEVHFGLGVARRIERLEIAWPDGVREAFEDLPASVPILIVEGEDPEILRPTGGPSRSTGNDQSGAPGRTPAGAGGAGVGSPPKVSTSNRTAPDDVPGRRVAQSGGPSSLSSPNSLEPAGSGRATGVDASDRKTLTREEVRAFWSLFREATSLRHRGELAPAAARYGEALAIDGAHEDSLYHLGHCRAELGDHAAARAAFERLLEVNPGSARGHAALGAILASLEPTSPLDLDAAERHFREAHRINREETGPLVRLAEILIVRGDLGEARRWLEAAALTNAWSREASFLAGYVLWESGDGTRAADYYRRAVDAGKPKAPPANVPGEGDRRVESEGKARTVAAPPASPLGATLFGDLVPAPGSDPGDPSPSFARVRARVLDLSRRAL